LASSEEDRKKFKILSANDVRIGGIIIGTTRTWVVSKKSFPKDKANRLAATARDIRDHIFYGTIHLRLMTWNMVLTDLQAVTASHLRFQKSSKAGIPLGAGPCVDEV
jgi:hypothetical protein